MPFKLNFGSFGGGGSKKPSMRFGAGADSEQAVDPYNKNIYRGLQFDTAKDEDEPLNKLSDVLGKRVFSEPDNNEPQFEGTKAYIEHLKNAPGREDYTPSGWRRFGAIVAGALSGPGNSFNVAQSIVDQPFNRAREDWAIQAKGLEGAADIENKMYGQDIRYMNMYRQLMGDRNRDENTDNRLAFDREKFNTEQEAKERDLIAKGWQKVNANGRVIMYNPVNKEQQDLGEDRAITIQGMNADTSRMNANTNRFNANTNRTNVDSLVDSRENRDDLYAADIGSRIVTRQNPPARPSSAKPKNIPVREQWLAEAASVQEAIRSNPAWKDFVDEEGNIKRKTNMLGWDSTDKTEFDKFLQYVEEAKKKKLSVTYGGAFDDNDEDEEDLDDLPPG